MASAVSQLSERFSDASCPYDTELEGGDAAAGVMEAGAGDDEAMLVREI